jgi:hypothetical protein
MKRLLRILILLGFGSLCFVGGAAYGAHAERKAFYLLLNSMVFQSPYPLPAGILRP